jgi:hypothetical protein
MKNIMGEAMAEITYNVKYEAAAAAVLNSNNNNNLTKSTVNGSAGPN